MKKVRGFAWVSSYANQNLPLPTRQTAQSAGYDLACAKEVILPVGQITLVPTGVKAYMPADEYLGIHIRSSMAVRHGLTLINNMGIIDADYYGNAKNEGHIMLPVLNLGAKVVHLPKGTRIAQGIFQRYLLADGDTCDAGAYRVGGFGSTGELPT